VANEQVVTEAEVLAAGQTLMGRGKAVTGHTLRQITKRGDPKRLASIWKGHIDAQAPPPPVVTLPPQIDELLATERERASMGVEATFLSLWSAADRIGDERVKVATAAIQERLDVQDIEMTAATENLMLAEHERDEAVAQVKVSTEMVQELEKRLAAEVARRERLQEELQASEVRSAAAGEEASNTRTKAREDWTRLQETINAATSRAASAEGRFEMARDSLAEMTDRLAAVEREARLASVGQAALEGELKAALDRATAAEERLERRTTAKGPRQAPPKRVRAPREAAAG